MDVVARVGPRRGRRRADVRHGPCSTHIRATCRGRASRRSGTRASSSPSGRSPSSAPSSRRGSPGTRSAGCSSPRRCRRWQAPSPRSTPTGPSSSIPGEPAGIAVGWIYGWAWKLATGAIVLVPLLFPDGRLPSRRWRPLLWASVALLVLTIVATAVYPGPIDSTWPGMHEKPLTIGGLKGFLHAAENPAGLVFTVLLLAGLVASVVVRFRRSRGDERQQLKWMLAAVAGAGGLDPDRPGARDEDARRRARRPVRVCGHHGSRRGRRSRCSSTACTTSTS